MGTVCSINNVGIVRKFGCRVCSGRECAANFIKKHHLHLIVTPSHNYEESEIMDDHTEAEDHAISNYVSNNLSNDGNDLSVINTAPGENVPSIGRP